MNSKTKAESGVKYLQQINRHFGFVADNPGIQILGTELGFIHVYIPIENGIKHWFMQCTDKGERMYENGHHPDSHHNLILKASLQMAAGIPFAAMTIKSPTKMYQGRFWTSLCSNYGMNGIQVFTPKSGYGEEFVINSVRSLNRRGIETRLQKLDGYVQKYEIGGLGQASGPYLKEISNRR